MPPWLRLALPLLMVALVLVAVDTGAVLRALRGAHPGWLLAALGAVQLQVVLSALRWRFTAARLGQRIGRGEAIGEYYLAALLNQTAPGGVGGDALRAWRGGRESEAGMGAAVRAVVLERLAGQVALFVVAATGLAAWPLLGRGGAPLDALILLGLAMAAAVGAGLLIAVLARRGPRRARSALRGLAPDLMRAWFERGAWLLQGATSLAIVLAYIAAFALCARALGDVLPPLAWITAIPLVLLSMLAPVSIGGWGVRETAAAALWPLLGLPASQGVAASVLYGLVNLAGALPGVLTSLRHRRRRRDG